MLEPESPPGNYPSAAPSLKGIQPTQNLLLVCDSQQEEGGGERMIGETLAPTQLQVYEEDREEGLPQGSQPQHDPTLDEPNQQRKETSDSCENYEEEIKRLEEETRARWLGPPKPSIASMSQALAKSLVGSQTSMTQLGSLADDDVDAVRIGNDLTEAMAQGSYEAALKMQILSNIMDAVLDSLFGDAAANIDSDRHSLWYWFLIKQLTRSTSNGGSTSIPTMRNLFEDVVWPEERENENAAMAENADAPSCDNHGEQTHVCTAKDDQHGSGKGTCPKVHTEEGGVEGNSAGQDPEDPEGREDMGDEDMEVGGEHILSAIEVSQRQEEIQASLMEVDRMEEEQPQPQPQDQDLAQEEDEEDNEMSNLGRVLSAAAWLVGSWGPRGSPAMPQEPMQGMNEGFTNVHEKRDTGVDFTLSQGHVGVMRGGPHSVVPETQDECVPPTEDTLPEAAQNMVHVTDLSSFSQSHSQSKQPQSQSQPSIDVGAVLKAIDGVLAPLGGSQAEAELLQGTTLNAPQNITSLPASTPTLQMNKASNKESKRSRNAFARRQLVARVMGPANLGRQDLGRTVKPPSRLGFDLPLVTRRRSVTPLTNVPRQDPYEFVDQRDQQPEGNTPAPTPTPKASTRTRQAVQRAKTNVLLTSSKRDDKESGKRGIKVGSKEEGKKPASPVVSVRKNQNRAVGRPQKRKLEENNKSAEKRKSARTNNKQNPAASQRQGITSKKTESQGKDRSSTKGGSRKGSCCPKPKPEPKAASQDIFKGINFLISLSENKSSKANRRRSSSTTTESGDEVRRMIEMARGVVVDQVPPPVPPPSPYRRRSLTRCHVDSVHALVAHAASRRPKYVYAALNGLPIVSPGWIKQCIQQGRLLPWSTADISPPKFPTTQTGFEGLRILIVSSSKGTEVERKKFFQHAGAAVVDVGKEFSKDNHDCDLLVIGKSWYKLCLRLSRFIYVHA